MILDVFHCEISNKDINDFINDYEIIENFDEKEDNIATSKKVEV